MTAWDSKRRIALIMIWIVAACMCTAAEAYAEDFADCEIPAVCRISSDIPESMDLDFTYTLMADDAGSPMPDGAENGEKTVHMTDSGELDFGTIRFERPDVFYYTLMETTDETGDFRRDRTKYHAALMADSDGEVRMVINTDSGTKTDKVVFANSYRARPPEKHDTPKTGDSQPIYWVVLTLLSCAALASMIAGRRAAEWLGVIRWRRKSSSAGRETGGRAEPCQSFPGAHMIRLFGVMAVISFIMMAPACQEEAFAQVQVTSDYNDMPANYVEIGDLDFSTAEFTPLDSRIKKGDFQYYANESNVTYSSIYWLSSTAPNYGSSNATATADANLGSNTISGDIFTLRFSDAAMLWDGSSADVLMTFSDLYFGLSKNVNGTTGSKYYYPLIFIKADGTGRYCNTSIGTSTKNAGRIRGVRAATRIKTTVTIVESGTDTPVDDMEYILGFRDFDVKDNTSATGSNIDRYAKHYSEGIGLISGYGEPVYLSENTLVVQDTWDGVTKLRGTASDEDTIDSGADISVRTTGFSYYWYGSHNTPANGNNAGESMGTSFGQSPKVDVYASSSSGGTIEKSGVREYLVNASTSYTYTPAAGYKVRFLLVDGEQVSFSKTGGTYVFSKLTETSEDSYDHTIQVIFHKPQDLKISKNVKGPLGDRSKQFEFTVTLSGLEENELFEITPGSTGTFTGMGAAGTRVSSKSFRSSSSGMAILKFKLSDDQFIQISSLTGEAYYIVSESASDHTASYTLTGDGSNPAIARASSANSGTGSLQTAAERINENDGMVTVLFTNEKGIAPVTGVKDRRGLFVTAAMIFTIVTALIIILPLFLKLRRKV